MIFSTERPKTIDRHDRFRTRSKDRSAAAATNGNATRLTRPRAALRYGFCFEGIFRQHLIAKGRNRATAWFSMLDSEWPARKTNFERWLAPENLTADGRQKLGHCAINGVGK